MAEAGTVHTGVEKVNFDRTKALSELAENGYTIIENVLSSAECDQYIAQYKEWLEQFGEEEWPFQTKSLIQRYKVGHLETTWEIRLKTKPIFAKLWETQKLLSSTDAIAIAEPAENAKYSSFTKPEENWFHLDQGGHRLGVHAYQGAMYLEETSDTDYCFRILEPSHKYHKELFSTHPNLIKVTGRSEFLKLSSSEVKWYKDKGCTEHKIPVPKGGMLLWDSQVVHDNCKPEFGRPNSDRWRFVVFSCMTPAFWTTPRDLAKKREAYKNVQMTAHWPSNGVKIFSDLPLNTPGGGKVRTAECLPAIAQTPEARLLMGADEYDFEDGESNGPQNPAFIHDPVA